MARHNIEKFKKILLEEQARIRNEIARINRRSSFASASEELGDIADYDNHPADQGTETYERTKDLALDENLDRMLESVNNALRKIDAGTYGVCDRCGREINPERLKVLPYAVFCIECQDIVEGR